MCAAPTIIAAKVALKATPVIVAGSAIAHRAAPAVQRAMVSAQRVATSAAQSGKSLARDSAMDAIVGGGIDLAAQISSGQTVDLRRTAGAAVGNIVASRIYAPVDKRFGTSFEDRLFKFVAATGSGAMGGLASGVVQGAIGENMVAGSLTQPAGSAVGSFVERRTNRNILVLLQERQQTACFKKVCDRCQTCCVHHQWTVHQAAVQECVLNEQTHHCHCHAIVICQFG
jgi:hypothetical protein